MSRLAGVPGRALLEKALRDLWVPELRNEQVTTNDKDVGEQARRTRSTGTPRAGHAARSPERRKPVARGSAATGRPEGGRSGVQGSLLFSVGLGTL